jgi:ABC-type molybdate transport system substrate-binding protein
VFEAAIANAAADRSAAQSFIEFLRTGEARDIMRSTGLVTL